MKGTLKRLKKRENRHSVHNSQVTKNSLQNRNNSFSYISSCVKLYGAVGRFKNQGVWGGGQPVIQVFLIEHLKNKKRQTFFEMLQKILNWNQLSTLSNTAKKGRPQQNPFNHKTF